MLGEAGVSELIRFLRFQRSPNPVSLAVIVTTSRFWPWQAVEDRRCVETLLCPALALDSRLGIGTAFLGLLGDAGGGMCGGGVCRAWGVFFYSIFALQAVRTDMSFQRSPPSHPCQNQWGS